MDIKALAIRFFKFGAVGLVGFCVDNLVFFLLSRSIDNTFFLTFVCPFISYEIAMFNNFMLSMHWVWRERKNGNNGYLKKLLMYNGTTFIPFLFRMLIYIQLFRFLNLESIFSNMIAIIFGILFNFFICEKFIFKRRPYENPDNNSDVQ
jgi:putative flippase GtrA